jgi:hypothetical protein
MWLGGCANHVTLFEPNMPSHITLPNTTSRVHLSGIQLSIKSLGRKHGTQIAASDWSLDEALSSK